VRPEVDDQPCYCRGRNAVVENAMDWRSTAGLVKAQFDLFSAHNYLIHLGRFSNLMLLGTRGFDE
jgi:hypothetical protein